MTFTNENLKKLKKCGRNVYGHIVSKNETTLIRVDIEALLNRLESAEALIQHSQEPRDDMKWFHLFTEWNKAKGEQEQSGK